MSISAGQQALAALALVFAALTSVPALYTAPAAAAESEGARNDLTAAIINYRQKLAEWRTAQDAYEELAGPYWDSVTEKRSRRRAKFKNGEPAGLRDYVLEQPPRYSGPPAPKNPERATPANEPVPVVADFLQNAKEQFGFVPEAPEREIDYKRAYARAALAAGLTGEQCVKIFSFESGGNGTYDVQAGLEYKTPGAHAITTALGYNQLLGTNSVELLAEAGDDFLAALREKASRASGARRDRLRQKIAVLRKMIGFSRSVPDQWSAHARLANTSKGLGVHALILDVDVGPLLQVQKLLTSVDFARKHGYGAPLTAAELEMMNLTGDGNGFDMVVMPDDWRKKVPTSNFFQRGGYERNPVASVNNTVGKLLAATDAKMETEAHLQGAKDLAAFFAEVR